MKSGFIAALLACSVVRELGASRAMHQKVAFLSQPSVAVASAAPHALLGAAVRHTAADPNWNQKGLQDTADFGRDFVDDENGGKGNGYQGAFNKMEKDARATIASEQKKVADKKAAEEKKVADKKAADQKILDDKKAVEDAKKAKKEAAEKVVKERLEAIENRSKAIAAQNETVQELEKDAQEAEANATKEAIEARKQLEKINEGRLEASREKARAKDAEKALEATREKAEVKAAAYNALCAKVKQLELEKQEMAAKLKIAENEAEAAHNATKRTANSSNSSHNDTLREKIIKGMKEAGEAEEARAEHTRVKKELDAAREKMHELTKNHSDAAAAEKDEHDDDATMPAWMNPADPRCGVIKPWSEHKPFEVTVGSSVGAKESQCKACQIRACNAGLPAPGETGGCRCMSYQDVAGNYATDCKNPINDNLPINYTNCGEVRDCDALEGQCVSATFKMDSAAAPPWMKADWKGGERDGKSGASQVALMPMTAICVILQYVIRA